MVRLIDEAERWHMRAEQARILAETTHEPELKRRFIELAAGYDKLAESASSRTTRAAALTMSDRRGGS